MNSHLCRATAYRQEPIKFFELISTLKIYTPKDYILVLLRSRPDTVRRSLPHIALISTISEQSAILISASWQALHPAVRSGQEVRNVPVEHGIFIIILKFFSCKLLVAQKICLLSKNCDKINKKGEN